ncbi:hypothetical protein B0T16DRAFT_450764 [Cercophora newfieldiana]|uniref:C2H2-type domain-containing protein n=1 Tax=Cercophora newfieldiana TaxID=92897 RepID=A0AA39YM13_9PEZI|nr:hypothetical protein B0T16DRAFT_450764 [Cercophora newfieldiana]
MTEESTSSPGNTPKRSRRTRSGKTLACPHDSCSEVFARPCDLRKHEKKHTRPYGCELCPRRFYQQRDLDKHCRTHYGGPLWPCPFDGCDKKFTVDDNLVRHIKRTHGQVVKKSSLTPSMETSSGITLSDHGSPSFGSKA